MVVNLGPLKQGGGEKVGLNLVQQLLNEKSMDFDIVYLVASKGEIADYLSALNGVDVKFVPNNPIFRILYEFFVLNIAFLFKKVDIIYTCFGFGMFFGNFKQVIGSADSNIYYPELDFWSGESRLKRQFRRFVDSYRIFGLKIADAVVFENKNMEKRGRIIFGLTKTRYIPASYGQSDCPLAPSPLTHPASECISLLFLCGWQLNKNVMSIPELVFELKKLGFSVRILLSAEPDHSVVSQHFVKRVRELGVEANIEFLGRVEKKKIGSIYERADYVMLLSRLESFSNNIIEAWIYGRPLIVADEEWSRSICGGGAVYVPRDDVSAIAAAIVQLNGDEQFRNQFIEEGRGMLLQHPSPRERFMLELKFLQEVADEI